jgi:hypothetical protein
MRVAFSPFLLLAAKASRMTATAQQGNLRAQNKDNKSVRALIGEKNSDEDGVNPFIIGGDTLNRTVWEQSRRYLVDLRYLIEGVPNSGCGGTKISNRVVLTAARELIQYK